MDPAPSLASHLTQEEAQFVYNVEILGLPAVKAASLAGMPLYKACKPHIVQAREATKREVRGAMQITKDDVVFGVRDAIHRAQIIAEPATEIRGWEVISKLLGYDAPKQIDVNVRESITVLQKHVRTLPDSELIKMLDHNDVVDAEFYEVGKGE